MKKATILLTAVLALSGGLLLNRLTVPTKSTAANPARLHFSLPDLSGKSQPISRWQGKTLVINFWATWCPPCLKEIPEFIRLQHELAGENVQFIGIAIEELEPVRDYLKTIAINYPILIGGDAGISLARQLGNFIGAIPFTVVVNAKGQISHQHPGELSREKLLEILTPLLENRQSRVSMEQSG